MRKERRTPPLRAHARRLRTWLMEIKDREGLSNGDVARAIGMAPTSLSKIVNGDNYFRCDELIGLADKFGLDIHWLLTGRVAGNKPPEMNLPPGAEEEDTVDQILDALVQKIQARKGRRR